MLYDTAPTGFTVIEFKNQTKGKNMNHNFLGGYCVYFKENYWYTDKRPTGTNLLMRQTY